jgi:hypothetical protein
LKIKDDSVNVMGQQVRDLCSSENWRQSQKPENKELFKYEDR